MKVVLQRVQRASVTISQKRVAQIKNGALLLVGFGQNDDEQTVDYLARKISKSRIFSDQNGKINLAINDVQGQILSVSQFTLYADTAKGNRPSFVDALNPQQAEKLYELFNEKLRANGCDVQP